jgi:HEAT repeat protein
MRKTVLLLALMTGLIGCGSHPAADRPLRELKHPPAVPALVPTPIDAALAAQARAELDAAEKSADDVLRAHALEELKQLNLPDAGPIIVAELEDNSRLVRKAAALAAGELQYRPAYARLNELIDAAKGSERIAIIFALHRLGDTSHTHELEKTAVDSDPSLRGDTALVLGMLGEKSAIPMLVNLLKDMDRAVRLQAADALWRMGDPRGLEALVEATVSSNPDDRMIALLALAEPKDTQVLGHVEGLLTDDYLEVSLVAARAAGMLGSDDGYGVVLLGAKSSDRIQRVLAGMAIGAIGRSDSQSVLRKLLGDSDADVRLVAAGSILQIGKRD